MIECRTYTLTELKDILHISKRAWEERKSEVLEWMKLFFDYEITLKGRSYQFHIKQQLLEYEPFPKKKDIAEIKAFYERETDHILQYKPRNTGANLAREINAKNNQYNHKAGTIANYIRPYLKAKYEVGDKEWCKINYVDYCYEPISEEERKYLSDLFNSYLSSATAADIIGDVEAGYINQEEGYARLKQRYNDAMTAFKEEYGFRPYKAGYLKRKAWDDIEE